MNRYLEEATQQSIKAKMLRFDDSELRGKTVARSIYQSVAAISFTGGTWCAVIDEEDYDGIYARHVERMDLIDFLDLDLITNEEFKAARVKERDYQRSRKLDRISLLQAELENGT